MPPPHRKSPSGLYKKWVYMRAIVNRLRKLERIPFAERTSPSAAEILEARRQRLGVEPIRYPPDWFVGCRTIADTILRARKFAIEPQ